MNVKRYKKGDVIEYNEGYSLPVRAGEDMFVFEDYGIYADVFELKDRYQIPLVASDRPGEGNFDKFLISLKGYFNDKKIVFVSIINSGIIKHLERNGIEYELESA